MKKALLPTPIPNPSLPGCRPSLRRALGTIGLSIILAVSLTACSTVPKVETQAKPGVNFGQYHTFALLPLPTTGPAGDPGVYLRLAEPARQAVTESLTARGLTAADLGQADLAINLQGQSLPRVQVTDLGYQSVRTYGRRGWYAGSVGYHQVEVRNYDERVLTIEIFDNHTKEVAWVGWTKSEATGAIEAGKVQEGIRRILAEFPPETKSARP